MGWRNRHAQPWPDLALQRSRSGHVGRTKMIDVILAEAWQPDSVIAVLNHQPLFVFQKEKSSNMFRKVRVYL